MKNLECIVMFEKLTWVMCMVHFKFYSQLKHQIKAIQIIRTIFLVLRPTVKNNNYAKLFCSRFVVLVKRYWVLIISVLEWLFFEFEIKKNISELDVDYLKKIDPFTIKMGCGFCQIC